MPTRELFNYPFRLHLRYEMDEQSGEGWSVSISRSTIVFETDEVLPSGKAVRLSIDWPAKLRDDIRLTLGIEGTTVQATNRICAKILRYEFRVRRMERGAAA